jgi:hypothetical protein
MPAREEDDVGGGDEQPSIVKQRKMQGREEDLCGGGGEMNNKNCRVKEDSRKRI